jgi:hypothetical protein
MKKHWTTWVSRLVVAVVAAAVVVPVAQATRENNPAAGVSHLQDLNAMEARYQAEAALLAPTPPGYPSHLQDLNALEAQSQLSFTKSAGTQKSAHLANRFDGMKVGIGTFGFALLLAGTWFAVRFRRKRDGLALAKG